MECNNQNLFPGQKPEEKVVLFARRHWISFLPTIFLTLLMIALPLVLVFLVLYFSKFDLSSNLMRYAILAASAYVLFILTFFIVTWIDYYFDVLIVTDERLVNIEQNGLFSRHISELDLLRVQNVSISIKGIFPTFFDYGCVVVQTAGENIGSSQATTSDFSMPSMPNPNFIGQEILRLHQELAKKRGQSQAETFGEGEIHGTPPLKNDEEKQNGEEKQVNGQAGEREIENSIKNLADDKSSAFETFVNDNDNNKTEEIPNGPSDRQNYNSISIESPSEDRQIANTAKVNQIEGELKEGEIVDL